MTSRTPTTTSSKSIGELAELTDTIGNEVYASHYAERKQAWRIIVILTVLLLAACAGIVMLARRPIANRYVRIDEMGRAQAIAYTDLDYSPREGEVRTYLTEWANYRYAISPSTISKKYPLNYYFLSQALASEYMNEDSANHLVSQVGTNQIEQNDVEVQNVTITSMSVETIQEAKIARGTALINLDKIYTIAHTRFPRTEHWQISVTYYLDPRQVNDQAKLYPQFELINPLGMTITEFHENRLSVEASATQTAPAAAPAQGR
ncbi:MAG: type IV secretion system protein [Acidobacteriaceae bacterium]|nr:type IV secretion system protein [Acidobacteriaceae bacterium]